MNIINYLSNIAIPIILFIIIIYGVKERKKVFDIFIDGAKDGLKIVLNIFPTLLGLFVAISLLRKSGLMDGFVYLISPMLEIVHFPKELVPLALLRPISGSTSIAIATDIMKNYGVDSGIGIMASVIMGATETTLYTIAVYTSSIKIEKTRFVLVAALIADVVGILSSVAICRILS